MGWHGARGSPVLARKPDAWSHCLALPGKTGKASAGVIKQHAGAAGSEQPASEVLLDLSSKPLDSKCHCVKPKKKRKIKSFGWLFVLGETGASSAGLAHYGFKGWLWSKEQQEDEKALFPPPSSPHKPSTSSAMLRREQRLTVSRLQ